MCVVGDTDISRWGLLITLAPPDKWSSDMENTLSIGKGVS